MFASTRPSLFLAAAIILFDGGPGASLRLLLGNAALLIAFGDMISLTFLLVRVF